MYVEIMFLANVNDWRGQRNPEAEGLPSDFSRLLPVCGLVGGRPTSVSSSVDCHVNLILGRWPVASSF